MPCHQVDFGLVDMYELAQLRFQCFHQSPVVVVRGSSGLGAGHFLRLLLRCHGGGAADEAEVSNTGSSPGGATIAGRADVVV